MPSHFSHFGEAKFMKNKQKNWASAKFRLVVIFKMAEMAQVLPTAVPSSYQGHKSHCHSDKYFTRRFIRPRDRTVNDAIKHDCAISHWSVFNMIYYLNCIPKVHTVRPPLTVTELPFHTLLLLECNLHKALQYKIIPSAKNLCTCAINLTLKQGGRASTV